MNYYPPNYWQGYPGQRLVAANMVDAIGFRLYDTFRIKAGTAIPTTPFEFFQSPLGTRVAGLNFATTYAKNLQDTNMKTNQTLPKGQFFRIGSMQIMITPVGSTDTTYGSSGPGTELPTDPSYAVAVASTNLTVATAQASFYTFRVAEKNYEQGRGDMFPPAYGYCGFAGGGATPNTVDDAGAQSDPALTSTFESVTNIGFGRPWIFPIPRDIDQLRDFGVQGQFAYELTPSRNMTITCILEGLLLRPVQ